MKIQALAQFTRQQSLAGSDSVEVLDKFLLYAKLCKDPQNIFAYMQEKAICTFISHYWIGKAEYYAEIGDYKSAFQYIKQAQTRKGISDQDEQRIVVPQMYLERYKKQVISQMRRQPIAGKRSVEQFEFVSTEQDSMSGDQQKKNEKLINLWNTKFLNARREQQKKSEANRQNFPYSWLYEIYKQREQKSKKISETIKSILSHSQNLEEGQLYKSLNTPFKKRDPKRISKTIDSVQMLKRKKSTGEKTLKERQYDGQASESGNQQCSTQQRMVHSIPVGRNFTLLKKHVTFRKEGNASNVEKIRKQKSEYDKSGLASIDNKSQISLKGGILRRSIMKQNSKSPRSRDLTPPFQKLLEIKPSVLSDKTSNT